MSAESNPLIGPAAVGPTLDQLVDALAAWAQPSAPFVVAGAEVTRAAKLWRCRWHPIVAPIMGHPLDALQWVTTPERWFALGIVTSGSARAVLPPNDERAATAVDPAVAYREADIISVRVRLVVTHTGRALSRIRYPGGDEVVCHQPDGLLVDACRVALQGDR